MRLQAPEFTTSAEVDGTPYEVDPDTREVVVLNPDHAEQLKRLGFRDPNAAPAAAPVAAAIASEALTGDGSGEGVALVAAMTYPAIVALLLSEKVGFDDELPAQDLLLITDSALSAAQTRFVDAPPQQYTIGEFVTAALAAAGLSDLSDMQAALDAIEAAHAPFAAFDPDGDNRPGGTAPAVEDDDFPPALLGSSVLPAIVEAAGFKFQLGGLVQAAFVAYDATLPEDLTEAQAIEKWNELPEADREAFLANLLADLNAEGVEKLIPATSIVERPAPAETAEATDPAEKPDFANMPHAELVAWLRAAPRSFTFKGNPSNAVAVQQAEDYWAEKHPAQ